jgi:hypothetical protein
MNFLAKSLVLIHTILSVAAMAWAITVVLQARDFGWERPYKEVLEYKQDGEPKSWVFHASEYDKSEAQLREAKKNRDNLFVFVMPALDSLRETEPYLPQNHLYYVAMLKELRESPKDKLDVFRFKDGGLTLETPVVGKPELEAKPIPGVNKSYKRYHEDLQKLIGKMTWDKADPKTRKIIAPGEIDKVEEEINIIVVATKAVTAKLTGTDEANKYVEPGIYKLIDLEFQAQVQLRNEIEEIKPHWSKAIEQARLFVNRRNNLEATLEKLKAALPKNQKK